ncbi:uncharacterized protein [Chironomus tepperi]|uniref:uncharacterized protein n=1 Tax=Chironomus tepperi TaxID=113505 RepID=UPI00391F7A9B
MSLINFTFFRKYKTAVLKNERDAELPLVHQDSAPHRYSTPTFDRTDNEVFTKWTITNCLNLSHAINFTKSDSITNHIVDVDKTLFILYEIINDFDNLNTQQIEDFCKVFSSISVVALFMSKYHDNFLIYWKTSAINHFLTLVPFAMKPTRKFKNLYKFIVDVLIDSLNNHHLGITYNHNRGKESFKINIRNIVDSRDANLLTLAAECGEKEVVQNLIELGIFKDDSNNNINAQSIAFYQEHYDVLFVMLQANFSYPRKVDITKCPDYIQVFYNTSYELHEAIKSKKGDKVVDILKNNPRQNHYYNLSNESATNCALARKSFQIYEVLLAHDVTFGFHENFNEIFGQLDESEREVVHKIHIKYSKDLPENHMNILMMNTSVGPDETNKEDKEEHIRRAYKILDQDPILSIILKTVAASKRFEIIFDFNRDSVQFMEASVNSNSKGSFYTSGRICIGAKQLLNPRTEDETLGTLSHELCHYAVYLTYNNFAKPYLDCDVDTKEEFRQIIQYCKDNCHKEPIVGLVFNSYSLNMHAAELIVRIPHMLVLYRKNPEKLKELKDVFSCLFKFFIDKVIPDMTEAIPRIKGKAETEVTRKNKKIWNLRKKLCFSFFLTLLIAVGISFFLFDPPLKYSKLNSLDKNTIKNSMVNFKGHNLKLCDLLTNNSTAYDSLESDHIKQMLSGQLLNLSDPKLYYLEQLIRFTWETLSDVLKDVVLNSNLDFQNQTVNFRTLSTSAVKYLTFDQIILIIEGQLLTVGNVTKVNSEFYVKRDFIPENIKQIYYHYERNDFDDLIFEEYYDNFMYKDVKERSEILRDIEKRADYKLFSQYYQLSEDQYKFSYTNSNQIIKHAEEDQIFALSAGPGAGKTVTFQKLAVEIKKLYPYKWVSYIDIKDPSFLCNITEDPKQLVKRILRLGSHNKFEESTFDELYSLNNVVILWNGFDEVSHDHSNFVLELIKSIQESTKNVQYICTRTTQAERLSDRLNITLWELVPFNELEQKKFLKDYFVFQQIDSSKIVTDVKKALKIIEKLNYDKKPIRSFNTPLMLKMIAEIIDDQNLLDSGNLYEIYDRFIQNKIDIWQKKQESNQRKVPKIFLHTDFGISDIFQKYALLSSLSMILATNLAFKINNLEIMGNKIFDDALSSQISDMGILYLNGEFSFEFAHRTYAEFFVAQYFINHIYNAKGSMNSKEAELRLELFYIITRRYGYYQEIISEFIDSYINSHAVKKPFQNEIVHVLETKFIDFFKSLLDTNRPKIFQFLINFFEKDHDLLIRLLHVNETETLYTGIFNPNNFANYINPKEIEIWSKKVLTKDEFERFIIGRNQKGKVLLGMHFYKLIGVDMKNAIYESLEVNANFWDYIDIIKRNLTTDETVQLVMSTISPKIYMHYDKFFNNSNFNYFEKYVKLWKDHEDFLTLNEKKDAISNALMQYIQIYSNNKSNTTNFFFLTQLFNKSEVFFNSSEIYDMFNSMCYLHNIQHDAFSFKMFWNLLKNHITELERKEILLKNDCNMFSYYLYPNIDNQHKNMSSSFYSPYYYDFTKFTILHRTLTVLNAQTFDYTINIYNETFHNSSVIQNIILDTNDLLCYFVGTVLHEDFKKIIINIEKLFESNSNLFGNFLNKKVQNTRLSVFEFFENFREIAGAQSRWFQNLQVLKDIQYDRNKRIIHGNRHKWT